jgi:hypothetical protein
MARSSGINTVNKFFNSTTAKEIVETNGKARIIIANNVVAHVDDLNDFIKGIDILLDDNGFFIFEVQYFPNILFKNQFDNIYHEHHSFFSLKPIIKLLQKNKFKVVDIESIETQGGSIRVHSIKDINNNEAISQNVNKFILMEENFKLHDLDTYKNYSEKIYELKDRLIEILTKIKKEKKRIVGYGAPAKGNTLLNFCKIGPDLIDYIIDKTYFKHGKYTPGMHIPVFPTEKILEDGPPDYYLLLVWNYSEAILKTENEYRLGGGKFIIPIPHPKII